MTGTDADWAIRVEGVSKKFGLTLRQSMKYGLRDMSQRLLGQASTTGYLREGEFWAVNNVSFEVKRGEALGIMGVNGCGKSTLLRILNGVYAPDRGRASLRGRVGAMIAAGAGFAPMLSGRENVYVNGTLLGLSTHEIDDLMDEIVAFSELGQFIDLPVKNYSSGMYVRLGFAIAALSRPDVLLMDEVLAVGDLNFQKKCFDYILGLKRNGVSIILVSHSPGAIWSVCDKGLFLDRGVAKVFGAVEDVVRAYDNQNSRNSIAAEEEAITLEHDHKPDGDARWSSPHASGTGDAECTSCRLVCPETGEAIAELPFGHPLVVELDLVVHKPIEDFILRIVVDAAHYKNIATIDSYEQGAELATLEPGTYKFKVNISSQNFRPGAYVFNMAIAQRHVGVHIFLWLKCARLVVLSPKNRFIYSDPFAVMHLNASFTHQATHKQGSMK